jgi:hypothetical protein
MFNEVPRGGARLLHGIDEVGWGAETFVPRTFEKWERRLRRKDGQKGQFIKVPPPHALSGPWAVEVGFPNGVRLRVRG